MLLYVLSAVIIICVFSYRYLGDGDTDQQKFCMMVHISPRHKVSPFGDTPRDSQIPKFWPLKSEYLENDKSQHYMSIRA